MTDIFKLHAGRFSGHYRFIRVFMFQRLYTRHFIHGYGMGTVLAGRHRTMVKGTDFINFLRKCFRVFRFLGRMQPVTDEMRADFPRILKTAYGFCGNGFSNSFSDCYCRQLVKAPVAGLIAIFLRAAAGDFNDFNDLFVRIGGRLARTGTIRKEYS